MSDEFNILEKFLSDFEPEIGGRSASALTPQMETKLTQLSEGALPEAERGEVSRELLSNQTAVEFLLARVRGA